MGNLPELIYGCPLAQETFQLLQRQQHENASEGLLVTHWGRQVYVTSVPMARHDSTCSMIPAGVHGWFTENLKAQSSLHTS